MVAQRRAKRLFFAVPAILIIVALALYFGSRLVAFAQLFGIFREHSGIRITQVDIALSHNKTDQDPRTPVVPKILHQIFHNWHDPGNDTLPAHWEAARQTCVALNPDWEHKVRRSRRRRAAKTSARKCGSGTSDGAAC
jgi:inositol phosphorylceramide mannosyltransferase catalytic subunit